MRFNESPRTDTSCVTKTKRSCCCSPCGLSSAKINWSNGSNKWSSGANSTLTPVAFGSLSQQSGAFVLIVLFLLMVFALSCFQMAEDVRCTLAESKHIAMQVIPKLLATAGHEIFR